MVVNSQQQRKPQFKALESKRLSKLQKKESAVLLNFESK